MSSSPFLLLLLGQKRIIFGLNGGLCILKPLSTVIELICEVISNIYSMEKNQGAFTYDVRFLGKVGRQVGPTATDCTKQTYVVKYLIIGQIVETVQDFLIKQDIKPLMHLLKRSIFSLNNDIVRLTRIMNNLVKDGKIRTFKVIFQHLKLAESFRIFFSVKNI